MASLLPPSVITQLNNALRKITSVYQQNYAQQQQQETTLNNELEFRLGTFQTEEGKEQSFEAKLSFVQFNNVIRNVIRSFTSTSESGNEISENISLDISFNDGMRMSINGVDKIRIFCLDEQKIYEFLEENKGDEEQKQMVVQFQQKERKIKEDIPDYNMRFQYSVEKNLSDSEKDLIIQRILDKNIQKMYRFKKRYSIISGQEKYRYDMTCIKSSFGKTFQTSNVLSTMEHYEVEIELLKPETAGSEEARNDIINRLIQINRWKENTHKLISSSEKRQVMEQYIQLTSPDVHKFYFIGVNVLPLKMEHVATDTEHISYLNTGKFSVTEKADGERYLLYIYGGSDEMSPLRGNIYMINNQQIVKHIGLKCLNPEFYDSIFDGEYVENKTKANSFIYLIFDCLFYNGQSIRSKPLFETEETKGEEPPTAMMATNGRYDFIKKFLDIGRIETLPINELGNVHIRIDKKIYKYGLNIYGLSKEVYQPQRYTYNLDGLIYTPINEPYPIQTTRPVIWNDLLKWKPLNMLSIDFYVTYNRKDVKQSIDEKTGKTLKYVTATLKVKNRGELVPFTPSKYVLAGEHPQNVTLYFDKIRDVPLIQETGEAILPNTVVEFSFINEKWYPLRLRADKTALGNPNALATALSTWEIIKKPVTVEVITGEYTIALAKEGGTISYYSDVAGSMANYTAPLRSFNNKVKEELIKGVADVVRAGGSGSGALSLLDLAVGQAGDLYKWKKANINYVLGIDISKSNLEGEVKGAIQRYIEFRKDPRNRNSSPRKIDFIWGDVSEEIITGEAGMDIDNKNKLQQIFNGKNSIGQHAFQIISCQFAIHYMFENNATIHGFFRNIKQNLMEGGYVIGTTLDGRKIFNYFNSNSTDEIKGVHHISDGKDITLWSIKKDYESESEKEETKGKEEESGELIGVGKRIKVYNISIGQEIDEYLVDFVYLDQIARSYDLEPYEGLINSTLRHGMNFSDLINVLNYKGSNDLTDALTEYISYHKLFIYKNKFEKRRLKMKK